MKKYFYLLATLFFVSACTETQTGFNKEKAKDALDFCVKQYSLMMQSVPDTVLPRTFENEKPVYCKSDWWVSGFYPGCCWYLYEYSKNEKFKTEAIKRTALVEKEKFNTYTHDLGFMLYCSYGNGYRIINDSSYKDVLLTGAKSLSTRFNKNVGCIKSWDHIKEWEFPVIIDNMMNLEFLFWASNVTGNSTYRNIAIIHANTTMKNHFRADYSSYHVINYDTLKGYAKDKKTAQGYSDESAWSRGQAWGLYGYTLCYRETKDRRYLGQAIRIAKYILHHRERTEDLVPYWDYYAPDRPYSKRDASAAAVTASALLELMNYVEDKTMKEEFFKDAETILSSLSSPAYLAKEGDNGNFILKHSVGSIPHKSEIDVPLTYADYYYIEALMRYINIK